MQKVFFALAAAALVAEAASPNRKRCVRVTSSALSSAAPAASTSASEPIPITTTSSEESQPEPTTESKPTTVTTSKAPAATTKAASNPGGSKGSGSGGLLTIKFVNKCSDDVWAAVGKAPSGKPDSSLAFGQKLSPGDSTSFAIDGQALGVRAWGRTGCDDNGTNCKTGGCVGGMVCTDAGITSGVILSEYGYADFGQWGGKRVAWDLSRVDLQINIDTTLTSSDGQTVVCTKGSCSNTQAYIKSDDFTADRNSPLGTTFTHTFCSGSKKRHHRRSNQESF